MGSYYDIHKALTQKVIDLALGVPIAGEDADFDPGELFTLGYDAQTVNFTVGQTLTGSTSGATGRMKLDVDAGSTGTLTLDRIVGTFVNDEPITDALTGAAVANGTTEQIQQFVDVTDLRAGKDSIAKDILDEARGIYQLSVYTRSGILPKKALQMADKIIAGYSFNTKFTSGSQTVVIRESSMSEGRNLNGWYIIDISIEYKSDFTR